jgi:hypothetical protein
MLVGGALRVQDPGVAWLQPGTTVAWRMIPEAYKELEGSSGFN